MSSINSISADKLVRLVGTPKCPAFVDVRPDDDFAEDPRLLPSSIRRTYDAVDDWATELRTRDARWHLTGVSRWAIPVIPSRWRVPVHQVVAPGDANAGVTPAAIARELGTGGVREVVLATGPKAEER